MNQDEIEIQEMEETAELLRLEIGFLEYISSATMKLMFSLGILVGVGLMNITVFLGGYYGIDMALTTSFTLLAVAAIGLALLKYLNYRVEEKRAMINLVINQNERTDDS